MEVVARHLGACSQGAEGTAYLGCPLGCSFQTGSSLPSDQPLNTDLNGPGRDSHRLADRMMASIRVESKVILSIKDNMEAPMEELVRHLCWEHLPAVQFIMGYAHELAVCACCPSILESQGIRLFAAIKDQGRGSASGDRIHALQSACPFAILAASRGPSAAKNEVSSGSSKDVQTGEATARVTSGVTSSGDGDDELIDLWLSPCDGGGSAFQRGQEAQAASHLITHHMDDLRLIAKHTTEQCKEALDRTCPARCPQEGCQVI